MLFEHTLKNRAVAETIERAVSAVLDDGLRTGDIYRGVGGRQEADRHARDGDAVLAKLERLWSVSACRADARSDSRRK